MSSRALTVEEIDELVRIRRERKLRQRDLAALAGTHERTIRNLEGGRAVAETTIRAVYRALSATEPPRSDVGDQWVLQMVQHRLNSLQGEELGAYIDTLMRVSAPTEPVSAPEGPAWEGF